MDEVRECYCEDMDGYDEHRCPYRDEILDDETTCTCCSVCEDNCAMAI